jgi:diaminopimelate decarboxylase
MEGSLNNLNQFSNINAALIADAASKYGTPLYFYDEKTLLERCRQCTSMPHAYGLTARYAMKANPNRTLLRTIHDAGIHIDASSLNEVIRANLAGIPFEHILLTTQEVQLGEARAKLEELMLLGLKYNVCSLNQLRLVGDFASTNGIDLGIRIHPGIGSGESATRNTGDDYSCFGIHLTDVDEAKEYIRSKGIKFKHIHVHIGSGADSEVWRQSVDLLLKIVEHHFPEAESVSFGGGLKEARMPNEEPVNPTELGLRAKLRVEEFYARTGKKLLMEIEPGTFIAANCGYIITKVIDKKNTSRSNFIITDGGMEMNSRPLLYGSKHPIYIVSSDGKQLKSTEFRDCSCGNNNEYSAVVVGKCCESGDCQTLDAEGRTVPRSMAEPEIGDYVVIGGTGAYCSSMAPYNYNSHVQAAEVLLQLNGEMKLIRKRQTFEQILENEV